MTETRLAEIEARLKATLEPHIAHVDAWEPECVPCQAELWLETHAQANLCDLLAALRETEQKLDEAFVNGKQCPYQFPEIEQCSYACTCRNPIMSGGHASARALSGGYES